MFRVEFSTSNAAFDADPAAEIERALERVAQRMYRGGRGPVTDANGNTVGAWEWTEDYEDV